MNDSFIIVFLITPFEHRLFALLIACKANTETLVIHTFNHIFLILQYAEKANKSFIPPLFTLRFFVAFSNLTTSSISISKAIATNTLQLF